LPVLPEPFVLRDRDKLASLMKQHKHSFRSLAQAAQVGKTPIHKLLNGQQKTISYPHAERLAEALGVEVSELFRPQHVEGE
jgi:transcriptional regulator with XRE-family HTH domain